jgi:Asp-tRNA(Asn)/Glu-tRNA(Gln) amidotransferase A subunit family amidase
MSVASKATLHDLTASEGAALIRRRQISSLELVEALLARIERIDPMLRCFVTVDADGARAAARAADDAVRGGRGTAALHGVPFAAKDIYDAEGLPTTAGYPPLAGNVAKADAFTVARLKAAGAVLVGKAVTTQFASGDPSPTRNPWRADRTPGGSSSGSAAAVAARLVPVALGTQTGGSILRPAGYNGVVGLKPTYGRVSRRGIVPLSWTLDHAGPIVRSVEDAALVLGVLAGHDALDPRSLSADPFDADAARAALPKPRLGLLVDVVDRAEADVRTHLLEVVARLREAGATVTETRLRSSFDLYVAVHRLTMQAEAAAVHAGWIARERQHYSPRIRTEAMVGQALPSWVYLHSQRVRRRLAAETSALAAGLDAFVMPTASNLAPGPETTGDPSFQALWSLIGWPSISVPSGISPDGLPFAVQLVARPLDEVTLLRAARRVEDVLGLSARPPDPTEG